MRAIIVSHEYEHCDRKSRNGGDPSCPALWKLFDRPVVQYVVEQAARFNVKQFDFLTGRYAFELEHALGDGSRWGAEFRFHAFRGNPYQRLEALQPAGATLIGDAATICRFSDDEFRAASEALARGVPTAFFGKERENAWTGFAAVDFDAAPNVLEDDLEEFETSLLWLCRVRGRQVRLEREPIRIRSHADLHQAHMTQMDFGSGGLMIHGRERDPGIRVCARVWMRSDVTIEGPAYIGPGAHIASGAKIGPGAVIGAGAIVERGAAVSHSVVLPRTYLGEQTVLKGKLADRNLLVSMDDGAECTFDNSSLLGEVPRIWPARVLYDLRRRLLGLTLLVANLVPALLLLAVSAVRGKLRMESVLTATLPQPLHTEPRWFRRRRIRFSSRTHPWTAVLEHYLSDFVPGLWNVVRADCSTVGAGLRHPSDVDRFPPAWRRHRHWLRGGLVSPAAYLAWRHPDEKETLVMESFFALQNSFAKSIGVLARYYRALIPEALRWVFEKRKAA